MTQLKIQYKKVSDLKSYQNNPRNHSVDQIRQIAKSIDEFGFTNPILIDGDKGVIAGHGRLYAAKLLEMINVPCIELSHLTEDQKRAYVIADNKLALNSNWDFKLLKEEMDKLSEADFDLSFIGLDDFDDIKNIDDGEESITESKQDKQAEGNFKVVVMCEDESDQQAVIKLMTSKGYQCS